MCKVQNQSIFLGLLFNDGSSWKSHRRFSLKSLRDLGFGKSSLEHVLVEEADRMGEYFIEQKGQPFLVQSLFNLVILNVLWTIVANKRYIFWNWEAMSKTISSLIKGNKEFIFALPFWKMDFYTCWCTVKKKSLTRTILSSCSRN